MLFVYVIKLYVRYILFIFLIKLLLYCKIILLKINIYIYKYGYVTCCKRPCCEEPLQAKKKVWMSLRMTKMVAIDHKNMTCYRMV